MVLGSWPIRSRPGLLAVLQGLQVETVMKCNRCGEYHRSSWHPRGQLCEETAWSDAECDDDGDTEFCEGWYDKIPDETFHMDGFKRYICKACGGDKFQVGSANWQTAIKCAGCGWEAVIHDG
jgi:RNase P subunit RPR2